MFDIETVRMQLDHEADEMCLGHLEIRLGQSKLEGEPAEMHTSNTGGPLVWVDVDPDVYGAMDERAREFTRRHELAHAYFGAIGRVQERMLKLLREYSEEDGEEVERLVKEFEVELEQAEEDICDMLARAFTRRTR